MVMAIALAPSMTAASPSADRAWRANAGVWMAEPSIHPMIKVAPAEVAIHTPAFAEHAVAESGDAGVLDGAKAMAMTIADLWLDGQTLDRARQTFAAGADR